jgi:transcription initiation factor TFIIIB Brf1 subunit/transcription initiation factor TFIIB
MFIANIVEEKKYIPENTPHSISAGIIYFVSQKFNLNITKTSIHFHTKISDVTISKCYKKLEIYEDKLIPKSLLEKYIS